MITEEMDMLDVDWDDICNMFIIGIIVGYIIGNI